MSNQMEDSDWSEGHTHLTAPSNWFARAVCLGNLVALALPLLSTGIPPCQQLSSDRAFYFKALKFI